MAWGRCDGGHKTCRLGEAFFDSRGEKDDTPAIPPHRRRSSGSLAMLATLSLRGCRNEAAAVACVANASVGTTSFPQGDDGTPDNNKQPTNDDRRDRGGAEDKEINDLPHDK